MHDPFEMGKDRHPRLGLHEAHEALAAARHDDIDRVGHRQHHLHRRTIRHRHALDRVLGQPGGAQPSTRQAWIAAEE